MTTKWFKPKRKSGFSKEKSIEENLRTMHAHTPKSMNPKSRWRRVGLQANALANVTKDAVTKTKARQVATKAFNKLKP